MGAPLTESLELAAEHLGDVTERVYRRYYADCPSAAEVMAHSDEHMQGRMLDEVFRLLMVEDVGSEDGYLDFEVDNHRAYNVELTMYPDLFGAVMAVVRDGLGDAWTEAFETAWQSRIASLLRAIESREPAG